MTLPGRGRPRLSNWICLVLFATLPLCAWAQSADTNTAKQPDPVQQAAPAPSAQNPSAQNAAAGEQTPEDKRVFGVFPNYRTTESSIPFQPITAKRKFLIGLKDSFDWPVYLTGGAFAGLYQLENQNPSFGQGVKGYTRRYFTALSDQVIGNMMTESIMPSILHEDPRYFRLGQGTFWHRTTYALTRIFVTRTDSGGRTFNFAEVVGNSAAVAISNAYYPDTRDVGDNVERLGIALATDAFSQVMKEFWPDVKRRLFHRHDNTAPLATANTAN
jgi:hypothetical protein